MRELETAPDEPTPAAENFLTFLWTCRGPYIEVFGHTAEQQVSNAASNKISREAFTL